MIINTNLSALYATEAQNESANPLQFTVDLLRTDFAMFEAVVNCDMAQAMNESGQVHISESQMSTILESTGNGIISKIKELIAKAKNAIEKFILKIKEKFEALFSKDKKIYKKHSESFKNVIDNTSIAKSKIGEFEIPDYDVLDTLLIGNKVACIDTIKLQETLSKMKNCRDETEFEKILKDFNETCENEKKKLSELTSKISEKKNGDVVSLLGSEGLQRIEENIKFGKTKRLKQIKAQFDIQIKQLNGLKSIIKLEQIEVRGYDSYLDKKASDSKNLSGSVAKYNAIFSAINAAQQVINSNMNCTLNALKKEYGIERKLFIQIASLNKDNAGYAKPDEKDKDVKKESFEVWALGEVSDIYMEEAFISL